MSVKKVVLILTFILCFRVVFAGEDRRPCYIYEERVNMRSAPDLKSDKVGLALIGEPLKILNRESKTEELYGIKANWYKVEWQGKVCYIWGGLFGRLELEADFDGDGQNELLLSFTRTVLDSNGNEKKRSKSLKLCRKGRLLEDLSTLEEEAVEAYISVISGKGFSPDLPLLKFRYHYAEVINHKQTRLYYWDGESFSLLAEIDDKEYMLGKMETTLLFPSDRGGKENTLRLELRETEYDDPESMTPIKDNVLEEVKEFLWDGKVFKKIK